MSNYETINHIELKEILHQHKLWLEGVGGKRANLRHIELSGKNLQGLDLRSADLRYANLEGADLEDADLRGADLRYADLRGADLRYADLRGANLWSVTGDGVYIKNIYIHPAQTCPYHIAYTSEVLQIGCQQHLIKDWWGYGKYKIHRMDGPKALKFWDKWKGVIKQTIESSPAKPTKPSTEIDK